MPSRNPSCEKCGSTMYRKRFDKAVAGNNSEFWVCCSKSCGHVTPVIWVA